MPSTFTKVSRKEGLEMQTLVYAIDGLQAHTATQKFY